MHKHEKTIKALGGTTSLGRVMGDTPQCVDRWRRIGIPVKHWPKIARICKDREIRVPRDIKDFLS